jgi:hypothetical protein
MPKTTKTTLKAFLKRHAGKLLIRTIDRYGENENGGTTFRVVRHWVPCDPEQAMARCLPPDHACALSPFEDGEHVGISSWTPHGIHQVAVRR